ncbi:hypothetical protein IV203_014913 [Nitzschia inconspicua]|uniref:Uncharacterized protein n=1 Tax=Nitzschia inconspicua TaxID=303405 RepID=A0A9K3L9S6_9STRA|nr:hypothetical protein IV203_014913 [Nitzschia inconspicua]
MPGWQQEIRTATITRRKTTPILLFATAAEGEGSSSEENQDDAATTTTSTTSKSMGDPVRAATGIRPSLHPTTINAIADALKARAKSGDNDDTNNKSNSPKMVFRVSDTVQPLDVAVTAGTIAAAAISKRQEQSKDDDMTLTTVEERTIAGRVVGVIMRLDGLERQLHQKASSVRWIADYGEWDSFGVLEQENNDKANNNDDAVNRRIREDPLFCMNRAECLLGLFLNEVEIPQLQLKNETVPDESKIDFLDADRMEVLIESTAMKS